MENEQTLQPPAETMEKPILEHIKVEETGDSTYQSQNQKIKTEEVDQAGESTNYQIVDTQEILANSVDMSDGISSSLKEIVPNSVGGINLNVDPEGQHTPQSPYWRSRYHVVEAIDCIFAFLAIGLEVAQIKFNNNKPMNWVALGLSVAGCLTTWMVFALNARQEKARFSFGRFFLSDGQIYGNIYKYIDSYASIIQIILSIISIVVKFPKPLTVGGIIISSAMIFSKLISRCTPSHS